MARRKMGWAVALGVAGLYLGVVTYLYFYQRDLLYMPNRERPVAAAAGVAGVQEIELVTSDGLRLLAWYLPPREGRPVVVYFHGNGGNLSDRVSWLKHFAGAGMGILMPEYRGYGGNPGTPSEAGLHEDAMAAMAYLRAQNFGPERIAVMGESMGTGVAARIASEQSVAVLILESPYTSMAAVAANHYFYLPVAQLLRDRFDTLPRIAEVKAPVLMLLGERDATVPPAITRELFAAAREPKQLWAAPEGTHVNLLPYGAAEAVFGFLGRHVTGAQ